jgi:5-methylcytosine-specific restriction endonuclease McrA
MSKRIEITGKRNIDRIEKTENPQRKDTLNWKLDESFYTYKKQIELINKLYLDELGDDEKWLKREIEKKLRGYKNQDITKKLINLNKFISLNDTIEKLVASKLKCFYCKEDCQLIYKTIFSKKQWTLDRINNNQGHNEDNVVICCYECNVKRGDMDSERFKRGKEIKIVRKQF